jgi:hypothetical protein
VATRSLTAAPFNLPSWLRPTKFRRLIRSVIMSWPAGWMSYGSDYAETFHQVAVYTGRILKGARPSDLPVLQSTKFDFFINLQTARTLGIEVPPAVLSIADEVVE